MFVKDGVAYDDVTSDNIKIINVKVLGELSLLVTFSNGEEKIFDMAELVEYPVYKKLKEYDFFKKVYIENGVLVWNNGEIDISPEKVYQEAYEYERIFA